MSGVRARPAAGGVVTTSKESMCVPRLRVSVVLSVAPPRKLILVLHAATKGISKSHHKNRR
jgi:hypothetical protein